MDTMNKQTHRTSPDMNRDLKNKMVLNSKHTILFYTETTSFLRMQESLHSCVVSKRTSPVYFIWNLSPFGLIDPQRGS